MERSDTHQLKSVKMMGFAKGSTHLRADDDCGSLEVWFADGRQSVRFYWDSLVSRRLSGNPLTREQAIEAGEG
jgi:hypothetical protein